MRAMTLFTLLLGTTAALEYKLEIHTAGQENAETDGNIYAKLVGKNGNTMNFGKLDNPFRNDFQRNQVDTFKAYSTEDIGKIACVVLWTNTPDAWLPNKLVAWSSSSPDKSYFYNGGMFLSSEEHEGVRELKLCEQGSQTYYITTTTATDRNAKSDNIFPIVTIIGKKGKAVTGFLDDPLRNDFEIGRQDTYVFQGLKDVGKIRCIEVSVQGNDAWLFDMVEVHSQDSKNPKYFRNENEQWLSQDAREGTSNLRLCA